MTTATERLSDATFTISRTFDAPRELVWSALTEPDRLFKWWGPKDATILGGELDLRSGGMYHYGMRTPDGGESWGKAVYREVDALAHLVWVNSFSDAEGGTARHPLSAEWPLEMLTTYTLTEESGKTTLRIEWRAINAAPNEEKVFEDNFDNCRLGWTGSLDALEKYLVQAQN